MNIGTYSYKRAAELAATINSYWFDRGMDAGARPFIFQQDKDGSPLWGVTSTMINGFPVRKSDPRPR